MSRLGRHAAFGAAVAVIVAGCVDRKDGMEATACVLVEKELATCSQQTSEVGLGECLERLAKRTDTEVSELESRIEARIPLWDKDDYGMEPYRREFGGRFKEDIAEYRDYRDAHCELWASRAAGGNGASDMRFSCMVRLNCERSMDLDKILQGFER